MIEDFSALKRNQASWKTVALDLGDGTVTALDVYVCVGIDSGPTALVVAGVHGDEYEGPAAIGQLINALTPQYVSGSVWLIPVANPWAFAAGTRTSPGDRVNLARVFPGNSSGTPTQRLAYLLFSLFAEKADYLIDLHSGGVEYEFLPVGCFYNKPGVDNSSYRAACAFGLPNLWRLPETPGVFSREFQKCGKVAIGAEYLGGGRLSKEGVLAYARGIKSCLSLWNMWKGEPFPAGTVARIYENDWILAPVQGLFHALCGLGDHVRRGDELAIIRNLRGEVLVSVIAEHEGVVLGLRSQAHILEGNWSVLVGREVNPNSDSL